MYAGKYFNQNSKLMFLNGEAMTYGTQNIIRLYGFAI